MSKYGGYMRKLSTARRIAATAATGVAVTVLGSSLLAVQATGRDGPSKGPDGLKAPIASPNAYPTSWPMYAGKPSHNSAFSAPASAQGLWKGYNWNFAEARAIPLSSPLAYDQSVLGLRGAPVKTTQTIGNSVGVTVVNGIVYAEEAAGYVYAVNAATGQLIWNAQGNNAMMGNPIVENGVVVVTTGDTGFSFSQVQKYAKGKPAIRGMGFAAIYGFNAATGAKLWRVPTVGEDMSSVGYANGMVYEGTGDGHVIAVNIHTGATAWSTNVGGFDSMSSMAVSGNELLVGFSNPNYLYAINATTGTVMWKQTVAGLANTGVGDNSPSVDTHNGVVIQDSVVNPQPTSTGGTTMDLQVWAANSTTGAILWQTNLGRGAAPPAYKAGLSMIHKGVVYVGSPITSKFYALDEATGKILWQFQIPNAGPAGGGRGGAVYYHNVLWLAAGPNVYALNPKTGAVLGQRPGGGRYGIVNPVIVGGTMFLDNSWGWIQAMPLSSIYPAWNKVPG